MVLGPRYGRERDGDCFRARFRRRCRSAVVKETIDIAQCAPEQDWAVETCMPTRDTLAAWGILRFACEREDAIRAAPGIVEYVLTDSAQGNPNEIDTLVAAGRFAGKFARGVAGR